MKSLLVALVAGWMCVLGGQVSAHHSFAATYEEHKSVTIEGDLVRMLLRNPHSFVRVMVKEKDGSTAAYEVEWDGAAQLNGQGVRIESLKAGDHVVISGNPGRNPADHRVRMISLRRTSDGFGWSLHHGELD